MHPAPLKPLFGQPAMDSPQTAYRDSARLAKQKNWSALTLCRNVVRGSFCNTPIPLDRRLCDPCLRRAHAPSCQSPKQDCSCGFSRLFWADVEAGTAEVKLSAEGSNPRSGNLSSSRFSGPETMTASLRHSTLLPKFGQPKENTPPMPNSEVKNRESFGRMKRRPEERVLGFGFFT